MVINWDVWAWSYYLDTGEISSEINKTLLGQLEWLQSRRALLPFATQHLLQFPPAYWKPGSVWHFRLSWPMCPQGSRSKPSFPPSTGSRGGPDLARGNLNPLPVVDSEMIGWSFETRRQKERFSGSLWGKHPCPPVTVWEGSLWTLLFLEMKPAATAVLLQAEDEAVSGKRWS